eukprot:SM000004S15098  [mRNA]  locus=s4:1242137:1242418:+ [translate_table: standard]
MSCRLRKLACSWARRCGCESGPLPQWRRQQIRLTGRAPAPQAPPGLLATLPALRLVCNLWAGVDHVLADPTFPRCASDAVGSFRWRKPCSGNH